MVLAVFLWSVRGALVVIFALPLSALLTFIIMRYTGLNANLMSLGGLAISIGMVIDATIIQVENVQRHLAMDPEGRSKLQTVLRAAVEVRKPSIFGELIIALTFIPIATLQGMEGKMFSPLAYTVALALLSSLLLSIFVIPTVCLVALKAVHKESPVFTLAKRLYLPLLAFALRRRLVVVAAAAIALVVAVVLVPRLGTEFVPVMDEGAFDMDVQLIPGRLARAGDEDGRRRGAAAEAVSRNWRRWCRGRARRAWPSRPAAWTRRASSARSSPGTSGRAPTPARN